MQLDAIRAFVKVAELESFTQAGRHLGLSKARMSILVRTLETELGSQLLQRSTRAVRLTPSGEWLLARARKLIADADEITALFQAPSALTGNLRVDVPQSLARSAIIPRLPDFLALHPRIAVQLSTTDQRVDVVRDGFDCVLRIGKLADSGLAARKIGSLDMINCASPAYLAKYGTPRTLADLDQHFVVHYTLQLGKDTPSFEYRSGNAYRTRPMRCQLTVNSTEAYGTACLAGLGIVQVPRYGMIARLRRGELVEVLPDFVSEPMPVSLVHGYTRNVPKHLRAWLSWLTQVIVEELRVSSPTS